MWTVMDGKHSFSMWTRGEAERFRYKYCPDAQIVDETVERARRNIAATLTATDMPYEPRERLEGEEI